MCGSTSAPVCNSSGRRTTCLTTLTSAERAPHSFRVPHRRLFVGLRGRRASFRKTSARLPSEHLLQHPAPESCNSPLSFSFRPTDQSRDGFTNFPYKAGPSFLHRNKTLFGGPSVTRKLSTNASALSEARFHKSV